MKPNHLPAVVALILALCTVSQAVNDLTIRQDFSHDPQPGYMDDATLVVELSAGFSQQSLFVNYADHGAFPGSAVEIIHRFELPEGAVVNDLWLWVGDTISKAIMERQWVVRAAYDSITSFKRDPAFLNVVDNQYELRVYPLQSGSYRRVMISFTVPTRFVGPTAYVDLPRRFLSADHSAPRTPVRLRVVRCDNALALPTLVEYPGLTYTTVDSASLTCLQAYLQDAGGKPGLTLTYDPGLVDGRACAVRSVGAARGFTFGVYPPALFAVQPATTGPTSRLIGLDLSGAAGVNVDELHASLVGFVNTYVDTGDSLRVIAVGEGRTDVLPPQGWAIGGTAGVAALLQELQAGSVYAAKRGARLPRVLFADGNAEGMWSFDGIGQLAEVHRVSSLLEALPVLGEYDVVAAYRHGYEAVPTDVQADTARSRILQYLRQGGTFLTYIDYNRRNEKIARRLVEGLVVPSTFVPSTLHRQVAGAIGSGFPASFYHYNSSPLVNSDSSAVAELINGDGNPVVLSKAYDAGLLVVTSLWHSHDDMALKTALCMSLLRLQSRSSYHQLPELLDHIAAENATSALGEAVVMSNTSDLVTGATLGGNLQAFDTAGVYAVGRVSAVNLLTGEGYVPPIYSQGGSDYYGSGYLLNHVAARTGGVYLSRHVHTWSYIGAVLSQTALPPFQSLTIRVKADGVPLSGTLWYPTAAATAASDRVQYFVGSAAPGQVIEVTCEAAVQGTDSALTRVFQIGEGSCGGCAGASLGPFWGGYRLRQMLHAVPVDTAAALDFAIANRLLCDLTAFIALEPGDTLNGVPEDPPTDPGPGVVTAVPGTEARTQARPCVLALAELSGRSILRATGLAAGTVQVHVFDLLGRVVFSIELTVGGAADYAIDLARAIGTRGTYVVVATHRPQGGGVGRRLVGRITVGQQR